MSELAHFTHTVEDVLDEIRSGKAAVTPEVVELLLTAIDTIKNMLARRAEGGVYDSDVQPLVDRLHAAAGLSAPSGAESAAPPDAVRSDAPETAGGRVQSGSDSGAGSSGSGLSEYQILELLEETDAESNLIRVEVAFDKDNPMNTVGGIQVYAALKTVGSVVASEPELDRLYEDAFFETVRYYVATKATAQELENQTTIDDVTLGSVATILAPSEPEAQPGVNQESDSVGLTEAPDEPESSANKEVPVAQRETKKPERGRGPGGSVLRVDSKRVDTLLNLVSEAVINKATFAQISLAFQRTQDTLRQADEQFADKLKELIDSVVDLTESRDFESGSVRSFLSERYGPLVDSYKPFAGRFDDAMQRFRKISQVLGRITTELQEGVMQIRMVPIAQILSRFPRLVRDVSKSLGKEIQLEIEGEQTELDKSVIEDLLDPLIHCVRNSMDHGIETPNIRRAAGKSDAGIITLRASNEGNLIVLEVEDDGKGINVESIHKKAVERGLIHPNKQISDIEAYNLMFEPGFSTAEVVTDISGRGVGLDVVRKQIEHLNGTVTVWSEVGVGTRITITLPLTLAILQGLLVRVGGEVYAIPIASVIESHRIKIDAVNRIGDYEVMDIRDEVVSLLRLDRLFGIQGKVDIEHNYVVVVGRKEKKVGLVVDSLIDEEDVVIKPLKDRFTNTPGIAGATILGSGRVALIIDVSQLLELGITRDSESRASRAQVAQARE